MTNKKIRCIQNQWVLMVQITRIWIDVVLIQECSFFDWSKKKNGKPKLISFFSYFYTQKLILLLFHEFSGVVISTRFRINSAKFDVIKKQRTMPARPKLNSKFCAILVTLGFSAIEMTHTLSLSFYLSKSIIFLLLFHFIQNARSPRSDSSNVISLPLKWLNSKCWPSL